MFRWRIYYDDGSTYDSTQPLIDAPVYGVQCIVDTSQVKRTIHQRSSYYVLTNEGWVVVEQDGLQDFILNKLHVVLKVVMGRTMINDKFWLIYEKAKTDEI